MFPIIFCLSLPWNKVHIPVWVLLHFCTFLSSSFLRSVHLFVPHPMSPPCSLSFPASFHPSLPDDHTYRVLQSQHHKRVPFWRSLFNLCPTRDLSHGAVVSLIRTISPALQLHSSFSSSSSSATPLFLLLLLLLLLLCFSPLCPPLSSLPLVTL